MTLRNRHLDRTPPNVVQGLYVVSVGNLAVGGTGKTPITSWRAKAVAEMGGRPAILHGGYGRDEPHAPPTLGPRTCLCSSSVIELRGGDVLSNTALT